VTVAVPGSAAAPGGRGILSRPKMTQTLMNGVYRGAAAPRRGPAARPVTVTVTVDRARGPRARARRRAACQ
jgi:hypothetical protein